MRRKIFLAAAIFFMLMMFILTSFYALHFMHFPDGHENIVLTGWAFSLLGAVGFFVLYVKQTRLKNQGPE
jgi:hypothetical protein